ncbi:MAG: RNA polymerase sigma factor [Clostridia bacterium]|nr:RNA polymerase sigma factor [Clostridia bacterium]
MDDSKIIDLFFQRSEKAIVELSDKYGNICMNLSFNILNDYNDAEECVNDSYFGVWNSVPPNKPDPLLSYVCRIVRNVSINRYKHNRAEKRKGNYDLCLDELENCIGSSAKIDDELSVKELSSYIEEFLDSLDEINRMIFVRRFWYLDSYKSIAQKSELKESTVRVRILRVKSDLKNFLKKKGIIV